MNAEELFLEKYGNKITASESWVIRFAEEYAALKVKEAQSEQPTKDIPFLKHHDKDKPMTDDELKPFQQPTKEGELIEKIQSIILGLTDDDGYPFPDTYQNKRAVERLCEIEKQLQAPQPPNKGESLNDSLNHRTGGYCPACLGVGECNCKLI